MSTAVESDLPVSIEAPLGVQSDLQLVIDAEGALIGVFVPGAPALKAGTWVWSILTLGVVSDSVPGVVAWMGEGGGPQVRRKTGVGIVFPALTESQRAMLQRARLLHGATVVPDPVPSPGAPRTFPTAC